MENTEKKKRFLSFSGEYFSTFKNAIKNKKEILLFFGDTFLFIFSKVYHFFYDRIQLVKSARRDIKFAALNNFHLSQRMLKENKITDALFRLHLANLLRRNSPILLYHLASVYLLKGNIKKCKKYLDKSIQLRPNFKNAQDLLGRLKNNNNFAGSL